MSPKDTSILDTIQTEGPLSGSLSMKERVNTKVHNILEHHKPELLAKNKVETIMTYASNTM